MPTPHPHAALMAEYAADMAKDQTIVWQVSTRNDPHWWVDATDLFWNKNQNYRRKPVPKPDYVLEAVLHIIPAAKNACVHAYTCNATIDGETGEPKSVELVK